MDRVGVASLVVVCFNFIMFPFTIVYADYQGGALNALKGKLDDPNGVLGDWDTKLDTCAWSHVTCNDHNNVTRVDIGDKGLAGPLVSDLRKLDKLQYLEVYSNKINGSIPTELGDLANLVVLDLYNNSLTGSIPKELGNLKNLLHLRLNDNKLSGPVPDALTKLPNLQVNISGNPDLCGPFTSKKCP